MAFKLEIQKANSTPYLLIDEENGYMKLEGESFHENVIAFYRDVANWLSKYLQTDFINFVFDCELKYFNSSTTKILLNMLMDMDESADEKIR